MQRRRILTLGLGIGTLATVGAGAAWLGGEDAAIARIPDMASALAWIDAVAAAPSSRSLGARPLPQVLEHAAQSIEYSLDGYPNVNSEAFRGTVGALAFAAFSRYGRMRHDTSEPIPGAPTLVAVDIPAAALRLRRALQRFDAWPDDAPLAPHFAYGALHKTRYLRAHLMHLADHAREVTRG